MLWRCQNRLICDTRPGPEADPVIVANGWLADGASDLFPVLFSPVRPRIKCSSIGRYNLGVALISWASALISLSAYTQDPAAEAYQRLCGAEASDPNACAALSAAIAQQSVNPPSAPDDATITLWRQRWGLTFDLMIGREYVYLYPDHPDNPPLTGGAVWLVLGEILELYTFLPATGRASTLQRWDEASRSVVMEMAKPITLVTRTTAQPDGSLIAVNDGGRAVTTATSGSAWESVFTPVSGGPTLRTLGFVRNAEGMAEMQTHLQTAQLRRDAEAARAADAAAEERAARREASDRQLGMLNGVLESLNAANEVASANEANSRAELEATLRQAEIQSSAQRNAGSRRIETEGPDRGWPPNRGNEVIAASGGSRSAGIQIEDREAPSNGSGANVASSAVPLRTPAPPTGARMGFPGSTCAVARAGAQRWVGSTGSFEIVSEEMRSDGTCFVLIANWRGGTGTASAQ